MSETPMAVNSDREYAESLIIEAHNRLNTYIDDSFPNQHRNSHSIQDSQECIELYVKSMFKMSGIRFPESHGLSFSDDRVQSFIKKSYNEYEDFEYLNRLPRVIMLTNYWESFYNTGKYGSQELNIRPGDVIQAEDIERALEHAQYCGETAVELFEYLAEGSVQETPD